MICNYDKGFIYAIKDHTTTNIYIGSSCQTLSKRKANHRSDYAGYMSFWFGDGRLQERNYRASFDIFFNEDWSMFKVTKFPCKNREELNIEEERVRKMYHMLGHNIVNKIKSYSPDRDKNRARNKRYNDKKLKESK